MTFETIQSDGVPIKAWTRGVPVEDVARKQLVESARLPFVWPHVAVMPDVHWGMGATVGSVIATKGAVIPAAVGVDIGCGMMAWNTGKEAAEFVPAADMLRAAIERRIPVGFNVRAEPLPKAVNWDGWLDGGQVFSRNS